MRLTLAELGETPDGWAEELALMEAGYEMAQGFIADRDRRSGAHAHLSAEQPGRPVYGTGGRVRLHPGQMSGHG